MVKFKICRGFGRTINIVNLIITIFFGMILALMLVLTQQMGQRFSDFFESISNTMWQTLGSVIKEYIGDATPDVIANTATITSQDIVKVAKIPFFYFLAVTVVGYALIFIQKMFSKFNGRHYGRIFLILHAIAMAVGHIKPLKLILTYVGAAGDKVPTYAYGVGVFSALVIVLAFLELVMVFLTSPSQLYVEPPCRESDYWRDRADYYDIDPNSFGPRAARDDDYDDVDDIDELDDFENEDYEEAADGFEEAAPEADEYENAPEDSFDDAEDEDDKTLAELEAIVSASEHKEQKVPAINDEERAAFVASIFGDDD